MMKGSVEEEKKSRAVADKRGRGNCIFVGVRKLEGVLEFKYLGRVCASQKMTGQSSTKT